MILRHPARALLIGIFAPVWGRAQPPAPLATPPAPSRVPDSPAALAARVVERFATGASAAFDSVYPFADGRALVASAVRDARPRRPGLARVVWADASHAVLALSGYVVGGNAGVETLRSRAFSDLYEAAPDARGAWTLTRRLPLDAENRIRAHHLGVVLLPGTGLRVTDTLEVTVRGVHGFAARLNHAAAVSRVDVNGRPAPYAVDGGLLWVQTGARAAAATHVPVRIVVTYALDVPGDDPSSWQAYFLPHSGLVRDSYLWHPVLSSATAEDRAVITVTVRSPSAYVVSTSVPQTSRVVGGIRVTTGRADQPTPGVTLLYDRAWQPYAARAGHVRFAAFVTPAFTPDRRDLTAAFRRTYALLSARFGAPRGRYFAVAQRSEATSAGWHFLSNATVVAGKGGRGVASPGPFPRAYLGHELAHAWTRPTGPGALLLSEGWATFAESYVLADLYGAAGERAFWEAQRTAYETGGYEGHASILGDATNDGVSYAKGAWVLRMLRDAVGEAAFGRGLRAYLRIAPGRPAGVREFAVSVSRAAGHDVWPALAPWVADSVIPDVRARVDGGAVVLRQEGAVFTLPLELELVTPAGRVRRTVTLAERERTIPVRDLVGDGGEVTDVLVDPGHRLLLHRHRGELARFTLAIPNATRVQLAGDFAKEPVPATAVDGLWRVEVPLTAGLYHWTWVVDGRRQPGDSIRAVAPARALDAPYPRLLP